MVLANPTYDMALTRQKLIFLYAIIKQRACWCNYRMRFFKRSFCAFKTTCKLAWLLHASFFRSLHAFKATGQLV